MFYRDICRIIGYYLLLLAASFVLPLALSLYYQIEADPIAHPQPYTTVDFVLAILITLAIAAVLIFIGRKAKGNIYRKEGLAAVVIIWLITPALSGLPFLTSGTLHNFWQAYFEMASGYTTTGSTILQAKNYGHDGKEVPIVKVIKGARDTRYSYYGTVAPLRDPDTGAVIAEGVEAVERTLLFWRSLTQWIGGGGIVVLFVAILPLLGVGGKVLFQAEVSGPSKSAVTPRIKETAVNLWRIYFFLTAIEVVLLLPSMPFFDALTISFSTISTGGFSIKNENIGAYGSSAVEWVVIIFMIVGSINFSLYYHAVRGKFYRFYETEFFLYMSLLFVFCCAAIWFIWGSARVNLSGYTEGMFSGHNAIRQGAFQMVSSMTSTGFWIVEYDIWPYAAQALILVAMYLGGMSGSTAGGIKTIRLYMLFRIAQYKVESLFSPETVRLFRIGKWEVDGGTAITVLCFFLIAASISALGTLLYIFDGIDMETALSLVASAVNNSGVTFRMAGPEYSCAFLSNFSLALSSLLMILGRLEYYALLAVLVPAFWRKY